MVLTIKNTDRSRSKPMVSDELDEEVWQRLATVLTSAHLGDSKTFAALLQRFESGLTQQRRDHASKYVTYILRYRVADILARRPTEEDLHNLAVQAYPRYAKLLTNPVGMLEDALRAMFKMPPNGPQQSGGSLFLSCAAAAGILLEDPARDLAIIRPHLSAWLARWA